MEIKLTKTGSLTSNVQSQNSRANNSSNETKSAKSEDGGITKKILSQRVEVRQTVTSIEEATELSTTIANKIGENLTSDIGKNSIIRAATGSLDPNRVQALIAEED